MISEKKTPTVVVSTCEAEYMALVAMIQVAKFLIQLLNTVINSNEYEHAIFVVTIKEL